MNTTNTWDQLIGLRALFYLVPPSESVASVDEVPNYTELAIPWFYFLVFLDLAVGSYRGKLSFEARDSMASITAGLMSRVTTLLGEKTIEMVVYIWFYDRFRLFEFDWSSTWVWVATAIGYDLGYYVTHRIGHEWNMMWAAHQTHHSSEYYNLSTALRQSMWHKYTTFPAFIPMAVVGIPPSQMLLHRELNLLYQFWVHTTQIDKLPRIFELILNTPSHHRVHHGRNEYCLDKNYAAVLIIWDRMFGTFAAERPEEPVVYGLVTPIKTYNPITIQCKYYKNIFVQFFDQKIKSKWQLLFCGPGWNVVTQRMYPIPKIKDPTPWEPPVSKKIKFYLFCQFVLQTVYAVPMMGKVDYFCFCFSIITYWSLGQLAMPGFLNLKLLFECIRHTLGAFYFTFYDQVQSPKTVRFLCASSILSMVSVMAILGNKLLSPKPKNKSK